jgi:hypothetical protein
MITDTHRLRRSIVALLDNAPNKSLSYENITKMFPRSSSGELRTNIFGLVRRGFASRDGDVFTLIEGREPTTSAKLYAKLRVSKRYSTNTIQQLSGMAEGVTTSAIDSLVRDGGLLRVRRGVYLCQELPPIYAPKMAVLHSDTEIIPVCPVRRAIWDNLTSDISDYETFAQAVSEVHPECSRKRVGSALSAMSSAGSIVVEDGLILKGDTYSPLPDDIVYAHIKGLDEVTYEEIKSVSANAPQNVITTLIRLGGLERITTGRYRVLPLPQFSPLEDELQETEVEEITTQQDESVEETEETEEITTWQAVAKALASVDSAKRIYEALQGEAKLKMQEVERLRYEARTFNRRADQLEATYAQPLAEAEQKAMEARDNLSTLLKQNGLI